MYHIFISIQSDLDDVFFGGSFFAHLIRLKISVLYSGEVQRPASQNNKSDILTLMTLASKSHLFSQRLSSNNSLTIVGLWSARGASPQQNVLLHQSGQFLKNLWMLRM